MNMLKNNVRIRGRWQSAKTPICGHKEPFLRKNEATTRFLGTFWV